MNGMPTYLSPREEPNLYAMEVAKEDPEYSSSTRTNTNTPDTEGGSTMKKRRSSLGKDSTNAGLETSQSSKKKMKQGQSKSAAPKSSKISPPSTKQIVADPASATVPSFVGQGGCRACGVDDDHANLLLCEICETEMHTYCLDPPLDGVPEDDWFCGTSTFTILLFKKKTSFFLYHSCAHSYLLFHCLTPTFSLLPSLVSENLHDHLLVR